MKKRILTEDDLDVVASKKDLEDYSKKTDVKTKLSEFENDRDFKTGAEVREIAQSVEPDLSEYVKKTDKIDDLELSSMDGFEQLSIMVKSEPTVGNLFFTLLVHAISQRNEVAKLNSSIEQLNKNPKVKVLSQDEYVKLSSKEEGVIYVVK